MKLLNIIKFSLLASIVFTFITAEKSSAVAEYEDLLVTCSPSESEIEIGQSIDWTVQISGGLEPYDIVWSGDDSLTGNSISVSHQYNATGTFSANVTVGSDDLQLTPADCGSMTVLSPEPEPEPVIEEEPQTTDEDEDEGRQSSSRRSGGGGSVLGAFTSGDSDNNSNEDGVVLGASTSTATSTPSNESEGQTCGMYLNSYMRFGDSSDDVKKLQEFLNEELGLSIPTTGYFGEMTFDAVKKFQEKYKEQTLTPWGITEPTGIVYKTTRAFINNMKCEDSEPTPII